VFNEFNTDSQVMVVLEGDQPLGDSAHHYYDQLVQKVTADTKHVQHIQDFWSDPLTAAGSQSSDGKAAYVQVYLAGNQGESLANESVRAVRKIVDSTPAPPGVKAYVTGAAALTADQSGAGEKGVKKVTMMTFLVILVMLLWVYRSIVTVLVTLVMVGVELMAARGVVSALAYNNPGRAINPMRAIAIDTARMGSFMFSPLRINGDDSAIKVLVGAIFRPIKD
jgi:putative drug exporter of the RND superfamily